MNRGMWSELLKTFILNGILNYVSKMFEVRLPPQFKFAFDTSCNKSIKIKDEGDGRSKASKVRAIMYNNWRLVFTIAFFTTWTHRESISTLALEIDEIFQDWKNALSYWVLTKLVNLQTKVVHLRPIFSVNNHHVERNFVDQ